MSEHEDHVAFRDAVLDPMAWQRTAHDFARAANYLLDWHDISRAVPEAATVPLRTGGPAPAMVLYAVAVENLLKALRIARGESPIEKGSLSRHFKHHRLLSHATQAQVHLSPDDSDLLAHLSDFMEAGRYPVPTDSQSRPRAWVFTFPKDIERVWSLLERLECALHATPCPLLAAPDFRERARPIGYGLSEVM